MVINVNKLAASYFSSKKLAKNQIISPIVSIYFNQYCVSRESLLNKKCLGIEMFLENKISCDQFQDLCYSQTYFRIGLISILWTDTNTGLISDTFTTFSLHKDTVVQLFLPHTLLVIQSRLTLCYLFPT